MDAEAGFVARGHGRDSLAETLLDIDDTPRKDLRNMGKNAAKLYARQYSPEVVGTALERALLNALCSQHDPERI